MFILGMDIGYSNLKLAMGTADAAPAVSLAPAGAAPINRLPASIGGGDREALRVALDGDLWAACVSPGKFTSWNRALHEDYAQTPSYRALFHAALLLSEREDIDLLVTGLPVSHWLDKARRAAVVARLEGLHQVTSKRSIAVRRALVVPQPIGGYLDQAWTRKGDRVLQEGRVLIIDPGFFSVDWVLVDEGEIRTASSGTSLEAMSVLLEEAGNRIGDDHGGSVPVERIEEALRSGKDSVLLLGREVPIGPYLQRAAETVAPIAIEALRRSLRKENGSVDAIVLTGGGAQLYQPVAAGIFPSNPIFVPDQSALANARGFFYFGVE
jgi:plasmid segregation protein ParM